MIVNESLSPGWVAVTESEEITNSLKLVITNKDSTPLIFNGNTGKEGFASGISLYFPIGPAQQEAAGKSYFTSLEHAKKIDVYTQMKWKVTTIEDQSLGLVWNVSPTEQVTLKPEESLIVIFSNIVSPSPAYPANRLSFLTIRYESHGRISFVPVSMVPPGLIIHRFSTDDLQVGVCDDVVVSWAVDGADECLITPGDHKVKSPRGSLGFRPDVDTTYALYAIKDNRTITAFCEIMVKDGKTVSLTANPENPLHDQPISLEAKVADAGHAWLNAGIGRFLCNSDAAVFKLTPQKRYNHYVLGVETAKGFASASCEVVVKDKLELVFFTRQAAADGKQIISWEVAGATECVLKNSKGTTIGEGVSGARVQTAAGTVTMECKGIENQHFIKDFP